MAKDGDMKQLVTSEYDMEKLRAGYREILSVYEYNVGSADRTDKKLCRKLEPVLETLAGLTGYSFSKGVW